jgi:hypothetical protein
LFGVEGVWAAQHRRWRRGWASAQIVAVFGAGGQDAFDGAISGITDGDGPSTRGVQAGLAVGVA